MSKKDLNAPQPKNFDSPAVSQVKDPYAHRKERVKYQVGYGAEGAARGVTEIPTGQPAYPSKDKVQKEADKANEEQKKKYHKTSAAE